MDDRLCQNKKHVGRSLHVSAKAAKVKASYISSEIRSEMSVRFLLNLQCSQLKAHFKYFHNA